MNQLYRDATWVTVSHVAAAVATLALQVVLARTLPLAEFGAFLLAQATVNVVESTLMSRAGEVSTYWLGRLWKTDFDSAHAYAAYLVRRELLWNCVAACLLAGVSIPLSGVFGVPWWLIPALALGIVLQSSFGVSKTLFVVAGRLRKQAALEISYSFFNVALCGGLAYFFGVPGYVVGYLSLVFVKTLVAVGWVRRFWPAENAGAVARKPPDLGLSTYSIIRNVSLNVSQQADVILLGVFAGKETVALYKVARTIANLPTRLSGPVWAVLRPPVLAALRSHDLHRVRAILAKPALALALLGVAAFPLAAWLLDDLLGLLYGPDYVLSATMTLALLAGVWVLSGVTGWMSFIAVITSNKFTATTLFVMQALLVVIAALLANGSGPTLAWLLGASMILVALLAWAALYAPERSRFSLLKT